MGASFFGRLFFLAIGGSNSTVFDFLNFYYDAYVYCVKCHAVRLTFQWLDVTIEVSPLYRATYRPIVTYYDYYG